MDTNINNKNFREFINVFIKKNELTTTQIAKVINCPEPSIRRILTGETYPSDEMIRQGCILMEIGFENYKKLSKAQKEKISEGIGAIGGAGIGLSAISGIIGLSGSVIGLSAAGITSGLGAIGSAVVGGGMVVGVATLAFIPIVTGVAGVAIAKGIKGSILHKQQHDEAYSQKWECLKDL